MLVNAKIAGLFFVVIASTVSYAADPSWSDGPNAFKLQTKGKVFAIGDLHGDLEQTKKALMLAGAIDAKDNWIGTDIVVVQTGDQIDRADQDREILDFLEGLSKEAVKHRSHLVILNGNHEIMNVNLDMRYVSKKAFASFADFPKLAGIEKELIALSPGNAFGIPGVVVSKSDPGVLNRASAFYPGQQYALMLAKHSFYAIVNDTVFVHGGITADDVKYGLDKINDEMHAWMNGSKATMPTKLGEGGPVWNRIFSTPGYTPKEACQALEKSLAALKVKRMVVGHSIQSKINSVCDDKVWRIDVALSEAYAKARATKDILQILEIDGQKVSVRAPPFKSEL